METSSLQPINASKRTIIVDILRGWALLGVVIMNYIDYAFTGRDMAHFHPDITTTVLSVFCGIVFSAKSWTLLSVLFGYGFAVLINNVQQKGQHPVRFFLLRMFWLMVLAVVNSAFWFGDILKDYAFLGVLLLLFYKAPARKAFTSGLIIIAIVPFIVPLMKYIPSHGEEAFKGLLPLYHSPSLLDQFKFNLLGTYYDEMISPYYAIPVHLVMLACFLIGYAAQKTDFIAKLASNRKVLKRIFWYSLAANLVLMAITTGLNLTKLNYTNYFSPRFWIVLSAMLFLASAIYWLYLNHKLTAVFKGMENMGRMTLTNYMVQNVISCLVFSGVGLGLFSTMPFYFYVGLAVFVYIVQVFLSSWWLTYYNYGPVEWLWRQLSYGKRLPIKKQVQDTLVITG